MAGKSAIVIIAGRPSKPLIPLHLLRRHTPTHTPKLPPLPPFNAPLCVPS